MSELIVGNRTVPLETASEWVAQYTDPERVNPHKPYGYPWYDTYNTGNSNLLVQGDLLAPVLLNVRPSIAAFASLDRMRPDLNKVLQKIDSTDSILDIDDIGAIGRLYMPLDVLYLRLNIAVSGDRTGGGRICRNSVWEIGPFQSRRRSSGWRSTPIQN